MPWSLWLEVPGDSGVTSEKMAKNVTGGVKIQNGIFSFICVGICCQHPEIYEINEGNTF